MVNGGGENNGASFYCKHQTNAPSSCKICDGEFRTKVDGYTKKYWDWFARNQNGDSDAHKYGPSIIDSEAIAYGVQIDCNIPLKKEDYPCKNNPPCGGFPITGNDFYRCQEFFGRIARNEQTWLCSGVIRELEEHSCFYFPEYEDCPRCGVYDVNTVNEKTGEKLQWRCVDCSCGSGKRFHIFRKTQKEIDLVIKKGLKCSKCKTSDSDNDERNGNNRHSDKNSHRAWKIEKEEGNLYSCKHQRKFSSPCQRCENERKNAYGVNTGLTNCEKCEETCNYEVCGGCDTEGKELVERKHVCLSDNPTANEFKQFLTEKKIKKVELNSYGDLEFEADDNSGSDYKRFVGGVSGKNQEKLKNYLRKLGKTSILREELGKLDNSNNQKRTWIFVCPKCQKKFSCQTDTEKEARKQIEADFKNHLETVHASDKDKPVAPENISPTENEPPKKPEKDDKNNSLIQTLNQLEQIFIQNNIKSVRREGNRLIIEFNDNQSANQLTPEQQNQINNYLKNTNRSSLNIDDIKRERERDKNPSSSPLPWIIGIGTVAILVVIFIIAYLTRGKNKPKRKSKVK